MRYSFNRGIEGVVFASLAGVDASYKDLGAVCSAIRHMSAEGAMLFLEEVAHGGRAVRFTRHAKGMGARHELGGMRGRYPKKCATLVRRALANAMANATNKGHVPEMMYVVHACANKTLRIMRLPPKGVRYVHGSHTIGGVPHRRSDIELARIEIGIAGADAPGLSGRMRAAIAASGRAGANMRRAHDAGGAPSGAEPAVQERHAAAANAAEAT